MTKLYDIECSCGETGALSLDGKYEYWTCGNCGFNWELFKDQIKGIYASGHRGNFNNIQKSAHNVKIESS